MVPPTSEGTLVSSKDILRCAARRLHPAKRDDAQDEACSSWLENVYNVVYKIWHSVGRVIEKSLLSTTRGVRIESLGTFALDAKGCARFLFAADFAAKYRLLKYDACSGGVLAGGSVNTRLNVARVAATAGSPRPEAEQVIEAIFRSLHQQLSAGKHVTLSFPNVAEFSCTQYGQASMKFFHGFREKQRKVAVNATRARTGAPRTKASPTPWGTTSADTAFCPVGATGEKKEKAILASPCMAAELDSGCRNQDVRKGNAPGERPRSALSCPTRTARKQHIGTTNRPKTSRALGNGECSSASKSPRSDSCSMAPAGSSPGRIATTAAQTRSRSGNSTSSSCHDAGNNVRRLTTSASWTSCRSSLPRKRDPRPFLSKGNSQQGNDPCRGRSSDGCVAGAREIENTLGDGRTQQCSGDTLREGSLLTKRHAGEEWLSSVLRRQILGQAGQEGLRCLVETLRLTCVSAGEVGRVNSGGDQRLSGRDLLHALRDIGTTLSSAELAKTTEVFQRQPDGRISLLALLTGIRMDYRSKQSEAAAPKGNMKDKDRRRVSVDEGVNGVDVAPLLSPVAPAPAIALRDVPPVTSLHQNGEGTPPRPLPPPPGPSHDDENVARDDVSLSTPRLSDSSTVARILTTPRKTDGGGLDEVMADTTKEGIRAARANAPEKFTAVSSAAPSQRERRQCWGSETFDGGPGRGSERRVDADDALPGDAIEDLAEIVFNPPSTFERFLHVLQASKVSEKPTMSSAALAARLLHLRPGLGKARAKQLAAATCRYPAKQVYLEEIHALLERRFGRRGAGGGTTPGGNSIASGTASRGSIPVVDGTVGALGSRNNSSGRRAGSFRERREDKFFGDKHSIVQKNGGHAKQERDDSRRCAAADSAAKGVETITEATTEEQRPSGSSVGSTAASRNAAAVRVQAAFRGHMGREFAAGEDRKRARRLAEDREAEEEKQLPRAAASRRQGGRVFRPKVASTYGF